MIKTLKLLTYSCIFILSFLQLTSCSKDSDLLSDYVVNQDNDISLQSYIVNDVFNISSSDNIVLDVLNNDNFNELNNVTISETSLAENGNVVINANNTLTYKPNEEIVSTTEFTDNFTYTAEEVSEDGIIIQEEGLVTINNDESTAYSTKNLSPELLKWKTRFDEQFTNSDKAKIDLLAASGNKFQEYYYMYYYFDGLLSIWQATGDNQYLDYMLEITKKTIQDAEPVNFNKNYLGWKADASYSLDYPENGVALWESYYWKGVSTLLRTMYQSPSLFDNLNYQADYDDILNFTETHIWDKWELKGKNNIYRTHTHMTSHWARIGMELHIITGKEKYKAVFENISFGDMIGQPSNLRNQLRPNPNVSGAVVWNQTWTGNSIQDTSHASDLVTFWVLAYENDMYWNRDDIDKLVVTLDKVIYLETDGPKYRLNVDGTKGYDSPGRLRGWLKLARYNKQLQDRLIRQYLSDPVNASRYPIHSLGNFALNEKILADGYPVYPNN